MQEKQCLVAYFDCYAYSPLIEKNEVLMVKKLTLLKKELFDRANIQNVTLFYFSDLVFCLYDITAYCEEIEKNLSKIRRHTIDFINLLQDFYDIYIKMGLLLKGGVSFGKVLIEGDILCGKPINDSVRIQEEAIAPAILIPERLLDKLGCTAQKGIISIPLKNNRVISALAILPKNTKKYLSLMNEMQRQECYDMTAYSGVLFSVINITKQILRDNRLIRG